MVICFKIEWVVMFFFVAVVSRIEAHQPCTHGLGLVDPGLTTIIMVVKLPWLSHCVLDLEGSTVELYLPFCLGIM